MKRWTNLVVLAVLLGGIALLARTTGGDNVTCGGARIGATERDLRGLGPPWQVFAPTFACDSNGLLCGRFDGHGRLVAIEDCRPLRQDEKVIVDVGWSRERARDSLRQAGWQDANDEIWTRRGLRVRLAIDSSRVAAICLARQGVILELPWRRRSNQGEEVFSPPG